MRFRRETVIQALIVLCLWTALGAFSSLEMHLESNFSPRKSSFFSALFLEISFTTICAALTPFVLALARRFRVDEKPYWRNVTLHLFASCLFTIVAKSLWVPLVYTVENRELTMPKFLWNIVYSFDYCVILYWVVVLVFYLVEYYRRYQNGVVHAAHLNGELAQAQLRWLKSRLHPHFLFNTLHTISALVREDPDTAERMIARLSDLLRLALRDSAMQEVELRQELEYLDIYLDIERTRFDDRLTVMFDIQPTTEKALVPGLLLQPIVENAIRHGIGGRAGHGVIRIQSSLEDSRLCLSVIDNGAGLRGSTDSDIREGVGLSSTRGRLERLYGRSHSLVLRNLASGGMEARITLPFTTNETQAPEVIHETVPSISG